ncbi:ABC transporter permease subunit [Streptomyces sp. ACA25]|uniref:ABC transporter permease subunit n=1 Tax=Streptomyces sp. ACA25 TaxID=3022596 RepID=UPI0023072645|nr:ABC transporter permease subunit [Streptomyces sp. ACA25]MDB1087648.1 ABC transporter permease subunit [Streptomyces sp. ACA25]
MTTPPSPQMPPPAPQAPAPQEAAPPPPPQASAPPGAGEQPPVPMQKRTGVATYTSPIPVRGTHLGHALASEWTKIRSVRSTVWTLVSMFAVTVGLGLLIAVAVATTNEDSMPPAVPGLIGMMLGQLAIITFGVLVTSTEYTTGMIRPTFTASPQRGRILAAKSLVFTLVAFTATACAMLLMLTLTRVILSDATATREMPGEIWVNGTVGIALYVSLLGLLALAAGSLLRSSAGAITLMMGLVLVPTIAAPFLYISETTRGIAEKVDEFSAIGSLVALSLGSSDSDVEGSGWGQVLFLTIITGVALAGAYVRLRKSDA